MAEWVYCRVCQGTGVDFWGRPVCRACEGAGGWWVIGEKNGRTLIDYDRPPPDDPGGIPEGDP